MILVIALFSTALFVYDNTWRPATCLQMTANDMQIPHQDIEEYTRRSIMFDELCDPSYYFFWMTFDLVAWGVGWYLVKGKRIKAKKTS